jgi:hypothetical protein
MALWFGTQLRETAKNAVDFSKHAKNGCTLQFERVPHRLPSVPTGGWEKHGRTTLHKSWHSHLDGLGFKQKRVLGPKHTHYSHWSTGNYFKPLMSHLWTMAMGQNFPAPFSHQNRWVSVQSRVQFLCGAMCTGFEWMFNTQTLGLSMSWMR